MQQLLSESTLFDDVSATREKIDSMEEVKQTNLATMEAIDGNIDSFQGISKFCGQLYLAMLQLTSLNPLYNLSLEAFLHLLDFKEEEEGEEGGTDGENAAHASKSFGSFKLTPDEHIVVASLSRKVDLNILRTDLPVLAVMLSSTVAEVKGLSSKEERETLVETLNRLTMHSEKQEWRLQPCLSQPEARVVSAVLEEADQAGERVSEAIGRIPELSLPQQICALLASGQEVTQYPKTWVLGLRSKNRRSDKISSNDVARKIDPFCKIE